MRPCKLNFWREKNFTGESAIKSLEKSISFRKGSFEDSLSKGQKTVGVFIGLSMTLCNSRTGGGDRVEN